MPYTDSGWQSLLPEAVAIVCAPNSDPAVGLFRLTDPPGLKTIINVSRAPQAAVHTSLTSSFAVPSAWRVPPARIRERRESRAVQRCETSCQALLSPT